MWPCPTVSPSFPRGSTGERTAVCIGIRKAVFLHRVRDVLLGIMGAGLPQCQLIPGTNISVCVCLCVAYMYLSNGGRALMWTVGSQKVDLSKTPQTHKHRSPLTTHWNLGVNADDYDARKGPRWPRPQSDELSLSNHEGEEHSHCLQTKQNRNKARETVLEK